MRPKPKSNKQASVVAGFPEFWQRVHDAHPLFFKVAKNLEGLQNEVLQKPVSGEPSKILRHMLGTVSNSFGALITLALNGYGNDAMKIARGMFEAELIASHLSKHPERVKDYVDFQALKDKRLLDYMKGFSPNLVAQIPQDRIAEIESESASVQPRFRNGKTWTKTSRRQMAEEAGLIEAYLTFYSWASSMHHADVAGLSFQTDTALDVDMAPSEQWIDIALISGHGCLIRILNCYNEAAHLGMDQDIQKAIEDFKTAWQVSNG